MMRLLEILSDPSWSRLVCALLHSLWQAPLLAVGLSLLLRFIPARRPGLRYGLCLAGLSAVVLGGLITWALLDLQRGHPAGTAALNVTVPRDAAPGIDPAAGGRASCPPHLTNSASIGDRSVRSPGTSGGSTGRPVRRASWTAILALAWISGVLVMLIRTRPGRTPDPGHPGRAGRARDQAQA